MVHVDLLLQAIVYKLFVGPRTALPIMRMKRNIHHNGGQKKE